MLKKYIVTVNGTKYEVAVEDADPNATYSPAKTAAPVAAAPAAPKAEAPKAAAPAGGTSVSAPLPGNILKVVASQGQAVKKGDLLCVLEAMKMENDIVSPVDGTVSSVSAKQGTSVQSGDLLFTIA